MRMEPESERCSHKPRTVGDVGNHQKPGERPREGPALPTPDLGLLAS